jgi:hypothetical protein
MKGEKYLDQRNVILGKKVTRLVTKHDSWMKLFTYLNAVLRDGKFDTLAINNKGTFKSWACRQPVPVLNVVQKMFTGTESWVLKREGETTQIFAFNILQQLWVYRRKWKHSNKSIVKLSYRNTQNRGVFGLCPSSEILNIYKAQRFGNWICFHPQMWGRHLLCWVPQEELISVTRPKAHQ